VTLLIRAIVGHADEERFASRRRDVLGVGSEEAMRRRLRGVTEGGAGVALDLPRGSFLRGGDVIHDDGEGIIVVERSPEPALVVVLADSLPPEELLTQAVSVGHWAGNQHLLVETVGREIRVRIATTPELMLRGAQALALEGAAISLSSLPFARERPPARPHGHG
jgi:urease accessory protein